MALTNTLILGDMNTGKSTWMQRRMLIGTTNYEHNYVILDPYGEYRSVQMTLLQRGYTVHTVSVSGSATLYKETIRDLFTKEKQAIFLDASQEDREGMALAVMCIRAIMDDALALPEKKQNVFCCLDDAHSLQKIPDLQKDLLSVNAKGMYFWMAFCKIWDFWNVYGKALSVPEYFPTVLYTGGRESAAVEWMETCYHADRTQFPLKENQVLLCSAGDISVQEKLPIVSQTRERRAS